MERVPRDISGQVNAQQRIGIQMLERQVEIGIKVVL